MRELADAFAAAREGDEIGFALLWRAGQPGVLPSLRGAGGAAGAGAGARAGRPAPREAAGGRGAAARGTVGAAESGCNAVGLRDAWVSVMRTLRPRTPRRLTARAAEQLLTGQPAGPDLRGLGRLLSAAAAPARPGELAGERAAVEGFRRAYRRPPERRHRPIAVALRRTAVVKAATGAAVLFVGGTALAAGTGSLPDPAQQSAHDLLGVPAPRPGPIDGKHHGGNPAQAPNRPQAGGGAAVPTSPGTTPSPDLAQLCRGYLAAL